MPLISDFTPAALPNLSQRSVINIVEERIERPRDCGPALAPHTVDQPYLARNALVKTTPCEQLMGILDQSLALLLGSRISLG